MQKSRRAPLDNLFKTGDVAAMPMAQMVAPFDPQSGAGSPFAFVPLFFFPEFISTNPIELPNLMMIRERTLDSKSELAKKCRNAETRQELHPDSPPGKNYMIRNVECLNFVVALTDPESPVHGVPITMTFVRGEFRQGQNLASLIRMRNVDQCYGCVFQASVGPRKKDAFDWMGFNVSNPTLPGVEPWVADTDEFSRYERFHQQFAQAYADKILRPDIDEEALQVEAEAATAIDPATGKSRF
jgi:hypothetical protein